MNVLLVATRTPDPRGKGDAKIAWQVQETLAARGHAVTPAVSTPVAALDRAWSLVATAGRGQPLQIGLTRSPELKQRVSQMLRRDPIDLVVTVHARATPYVPPAWRSRSVAFVYDSCALGYASYAGRVGGVLDPAFRIERRLMQRFERSIVEQFGRVMVLAQADWRYLRSLTPRSDSVVRVPYPVDLGYFAQTRRAASTDPPLFLFVGRLGYIPNADAVRQLVLHVWPALRARWPAARLRIVGAQPSAGLRQLLAAHAVELAADVEDVRREMEGATALLVPMRMGTGVQTKVLEAMAAGLPVICSGFANAGLGATPGEHVLIAETPQAYLAQAETLVSNRDAAQELADRARRWVRAAHSPAVFTAIFLTVCRGLLEEEVRWIPRGLPQPAALAT